MVSATAALEREAERVLKVGGCLLIDFEKQKDEAIFKIEEPIFDVLPLTNTTLCSVSGDLTNEIINRLSPFFMIIRRVFFYFLQFF